MASLNWNYSFNRMGPEPLDATSVFASQADFDAYIAGPSAAYPGQIVSVLNGTDTPDVYVLGGDPRGNLQGGTVTYEPVGTGGPAPDLEEAIDQHDRSLLAHPDIRAEIAELRAMIRIPQALTLFAQDANGDFYCPEDGLGDHVIASTPDGNYRMVMLAVAEER